MLSLWTWFRFEKKSAKFRLGKLSCHCRLNCHHLLFQNERPTWRLVEQVLPLPSDPGPGSHLPMPAWKFLFKKKILKNELEDSKTTRWAIKKSKALTSFPPPPPASTAPGCHPSWVTISPLQVFFYHVDFHIVFYYAWVIVDFALVWTFSCMYHVVSFKYISKHGCKITKVALERFLRIMNSAVIVKFYVLSKRLVTDLVSLQCES